MNIILCGLPMSGKTTIGKMLAERLKWVFIDTDRYIEKAYFLKTGKDSSCRQIYLEEGEKAFRELEKEQIAALQAMHGQIIALGGGSFGDPENIKAIESLGYIVYLKTALPVLWKRVKWKGVPAYLDVQDPEKAFYTLAEKRMLLYEKAANAIIETGQLTKKEIVEAILTHRNSKHGK